ncbi:MAG TPA: PhnD/SsuA/transferrin family substrate-binding protein [Anaeromyxobacteraceae bacterium]|nr:PhnD/SsuA/transferrin family substrate-binding protein [Anaeromyxobacteraceae bacterium]
MPPRLALLALLTAAPAIARAGPATLVACAPGYPGTTAEARPSLDALAAALSEAAGWPRDALRAEYHQAERAGVERLSKPDAALAMVPLPFFLKHEAALRLEPRLLVQSEGGSLLEAWTLVAGKGKVGSAAALQGYTVASLAGYAPDFVRGALGTWGRIPEAAQVTFSAQVLSGLRKAALGEKVALLLDAAQAAALPTLPFAPELEVVARSAPLPAALVCTVRERLPPARWKTLEAAFLALPGRPAGQAALAGVRVVRFAPLDQASLDAARRLPRGSR